VLGAPGFAIWAIYWLAVWVGCSPNWWWLTVLFTAAFGAAPAVWAFRARAILKSDLRRAAADRYNSPSPG